MSALREWAASVGSEAYGAVAVSQWGKWKTASQARAALSPCCRRAAAVTLARANVVLVLNVLAFLAS